MWPNAHAGADLQVFLIFCFKPILLSAHKLSLLIYGDNTSINIFGYALGCALCLHSKNYTIYLKSKKI